MVLMNLWQGSWLGRGVDHVAYAQNLDSYLSGVDQALWEADRIVDGTPIMSGIGYVSVDDDIRQVLTGLAVLVGYVHRLPQDLSDQLDHRLFLAFNKGPKAVLAGIRMEDLSTDNVSGLRSVNDPGSRGWFPGDEYTPDQVGFHDLAGIGDTLSGDELFEKYFEGVHEQWVLTRAGEEPVSARDFLMAVLAQGEFDHHDYHPVRDAFSDFLDFTIVWPLFKAATGWDPLTGDQLDELDRLLLAGFALVDALAIVLALPSGMSSLSGSVAVRVVAGVVVRELTFNAVATALGMSAAQLCECLGLPAWVGMMAGVGLGFTLSVAGSVVVVEWAGRTYHVGPNGELVHGYPGGAPDGSGTTGGASDPAGLDSLGTGPGDSSHNPGVSDTPGHSGQPPEGAPDFTPPGQAPDGSATGGSATGGSTPGPGASGTTIGSTPVEPGHVHVDPVANTGATAAIGGGGGVPPGAIHIPPPAATVPVPGLGRGVDADDAVKRVEDANGRIAEALLNGSMIDSFQSLLDDYALVYGDVVASNRVWSWLTDIPFGENLTKSQQAAIRTRAIELGLIPAVEVVTVPRVEVTGVLTDSGTYRFADFEGAGLVETTLHLPESLWLDTDARQFDYLDELAGGKLPGYTWHHTEKPGVMQRVPMGIHNVYNHNGGRSPGMWACASR